MRSRGPPKDPSGVQSKASGEVQGAKSLETVGFDGFLKMLGPFNFALMILPEPPGSQGPGHRPNWPCGKFGIEKTHQGGYGIGKPNYTITGN